MATYNQDDEKFLLIWRQFEGRIYRKALQILGNRDDAQDAYQEVSVRILLKMDSFRGESQHSTWIFAIVTNVCRTKLEQRKDKSDKLSLEPDDEAHRIEDPESNPHAILERAEGQDWSERLISRLHGNSQIIARMHYIEDLGYSEIAARLGLAEGTIAASLSKSRKRMKKLQNDEMKGTKR